MMLRRLVAVVLSTLLLCPLAAAAASERRYTDVPPGDWSAPAIESAAHYGLMEGVGDGRFGFGQEINRASFAKLLCNLFAWDRAQSAATYTDTAHHWAEGWIEAVAAHGAAEPGGAFRPDQAITREEMAVMLLRALDYDQLAAAMEHVPLPFPDVESNRGYIALAYRFGIINGGTRDGKSYFFPNEACSRETAAAMLVRVYERYHAKIDWLHGFYAFDSYSQIDLTTRMDAVSVGWARLDTNEDGVPFLNQTTKNNNEWVVPQGAQLATDTFAANATACHLSVYSDGADLTALLTDAQRRSQSVAALVEGAGPYGGLTIDFEGLRTDKKESFTAFMTELRAALPAHKTLWVAVQPPDWYGGYDYRALGELCDKVILMAHDYKDRATPVVGSTATNNPVSPINSVCAALAAITHPESGVQDRDKIALAIAMDSAGYQVDAGGVISAATLYSPGTGTLAERLRQSDVLRGWSDIYRNPYVTYVGDDGNTYKVWYEDARSVTEKVRLAAMFGINGISLWRLGILPTVADAGLDYNVWGAIEARRETA